MEPRQTSEAGGEPPQVLTVEQRYVQMCEDIRFTDEISLKLLGLIPLVSGAGILAVLFSGSDRSGADAAILGGFVGLLGATVTFAIYRWELRNIAFCRHLRHQVAALERNVALLESGHHLGRPEPPTLGRGRWQPQVGKTEAERVLYIAVIISWLALPGIAALIA